uniref:RRM domain-containing protein n=1 Tax=Alexandrium catenella TaxID=2925 RepID=A0A7S1RR79_ALECA
MPTTALDLTQGITEYSSRIALKMLFGQFGEVTACWIPPLEHRGSERAYVKFNTAKAAQAALDASNAGQLYLDGVNLKAEWRLAAARTQDSRDFEARGSNLMTSRDLMRAEAKKARDEREKPKRKERNRSREAERTERRKRSRSRERRRRERSRSNRSGDRGDRGRARSRSKKSEEPVALEDKQGSDDEVTSMVI